MKRLLINNWDEKKPAIRSKKAILDQYLDVLNNEVWPEISHEFDDRINSLEGQAYIEEIQYKGGSILGNWVPIRLTSEYIELLIDTGRLRTLADYCTGGHVCPFEEIANRSNKELNSNKGTMFESTGPNSKIATFYRHTTAMPRRIKDKTQEYIDILSDIFEENEFKVIECTNGSVNITYRLVSDDYLNLVNTYDK